MGPQQRSLSQLIHRVRARLKARDAVRGVFITIAAAVASLMVAAIAAGPLASKPVLVFALRVLPLVVTLMAAWLFIVRPLRLKTTDVELARYVEEKCEAQKGGLSDRLVTAVEYVEDNRAASPAIVSRLVEDAGARSTHVDPDAVVDPRRAFAYGAGAALILIASLVLFFAGPPGLSEGVAALYSPLGGSVSASATFINVSPGSARVPRGSDQKIKASLNGFDAQMAQVFIRKLDANNWVATSMEPAKNYGEFQLVLFNIQDSISYYVEASGIRSPEFSLEVADLPFVKQIDLVLDFPDYTRLATKKIENGGEVAALKGTVVTVIARLSASAKAARIVMSDGTKLDMAAQGDSLFAGQFKVAANGTYRIEITSIDGERYNGSNEYDITVLEDHPPTVVIDKPGRDMKVTSIQEIFTQARAEDDYGVASVELVYSANGGEEKRVQLQDLKKDSPTVLSGAHTFFLEEFGLQPGDFISYYAKARDNTVGGGQESTSDIYFFEVRPFDREFRQAQQQGGGQGGEQDSNALTRRQREIVAATFRVQREQQQYTPPEKEENFGAVTLSQEKLKTDADALAERIRRRLGEQLNAQPDFAKLVEYLTQASKEMTAAASELRARKAKEALPPEQRALQQLLRAEAIFREIQIARGNQQGGGRSQQDQQELADLFELQLDKMKNQYETVQREQQASGNQQQDEIARRLAELARRQQQQIEQRMRSQQQQQGGGGGGGQRQQQEMIDEAQQMARELEKLSRDRRDPKLAETARQLQQAADEMKRAQNSSSSNGAESSAQSLRALERLEQARQSLESSQRSAGQQDVQKLRREAEEALKRQDEIARNVDQMARAGQSAEQTPEKRQQLTGRKEALADQLSGLERELDQTARSLGADRQQAGDKLRDAAGAIRRNKIPERIRQNSQLIDNGWYEPARERERIIRGNIEEVLKDIQAAEGTAGRASATESLEEALNRARELADNLESLRRRMESGEGQDQTRQRQNQSGSQQQQGQSGQQQSPQQQPQAGGQQGQRGQQQARDQRNPGQQPRGQQNQSGQQQSGQQQSGQQGQQSGQQQSGQQAQQSGQQRSGQQSGQQGQQSGQQQSGQNQSSGRQQGGQQRSQSATTETEQAQMGGGPPRPGSRQIESELRQRLAEIEDLRKLLGRNTDLARDLNRAIEQLRRINPNVFSDPNQLALLKSEVIDPLRQLEIDLARRLQAKLGNSGAGGFTEADAPDRYRKMIEEYYRRLSMRSPEPRP